MYTAVLMMAMSTGAEVPDFRCHRRCSGCCCRSYCCSSCCGGYYGGNYYPVYPGGMREMPKKEMPKKEELPVPKKTTVTAPAYVLVNLPAQARLLVDDQPTGSGTSQRVFQTPPLEGGQQYVYELRAEIDRDGRTLTQTQRVVVRPGVQTRVSFNFAPSTVVVRSPN